MPEDQIAVSPALEPEITAPLEPEAPKPEEPPVVTPPVKTFTQEELDAAIGKRLAREERKWQRQSLNGEPTKSSEPVPTIDNFATPEAYAEALAVQKAEQLVEKREQARRQTALIDAHYDRVDAIKDKYSDFDTVVQNPRLRITTEMAETIVESDNGPDIAYFLGNNPAEAERIAKLSPLSQAKEIGKIESKLIAEPTIKKSTNAPAPISPVVPRGGSAVYDTTDPRSDKAMTTAEWIAAENLRMIKRAESSRGR